MPTPDEKQPLLHNTTPGGEQSDIDELKSKMSAAAAALNTTLASSRPEFQAPGYRLQYYLHTLIETPDNILLATSLMEKANEIIKLTNTPVPDLHALVPLCEEYKRLADSAPGHPNTGGLAAAKICYIPGIALLIAALANLIVCTILYHAIPSTAPIIVPLTFWGTIGFFSAGALLAGCGGLMNCTNSRRDVSGTMHEIAEEATKETPPPPPSTLQF